MHGEISCTRHNNPFVLVWISCGTHGLVCASHTDPSSFSFLFLSSNMQLQHASLAWSNFCSCVPDGSMVSYISLQSDVNCFYVTTFMLNMSGSSFCCTNYDTHIFKYMQHIVLYYIRFRTFYV